MATVLAGGALVLERGALIPGTAGECAAAAVAGDGWDTAALRLY